MVYCNKDIKEYCASHEFRVYSNLTVLFPAAIICSIAFVLDDFANIGSSIRYAYFIAAGIMTGLLFHYVRKGIIKSTFENGFLHFEWTKKPIFHFIKLPAPISYDDIKKFEDRNMMYRHNTVYDLSIEHKKAFRIRRSQFWNETKDDFSKFQLSIQIILNEPGRAWRL